MSDFRIFHGCQGLIDRSEPGHHLSAWNHQPMTLGEGQTHFGFVWQGPCQITTGSGNFTLSEGMYFSVPGSLTIEGGCGFAVSHLAWNGFFQVGGPIEDHGRLRYIDGCTDSLLVPPILVGDPCLNLLHFPQGVHQTAHTHPTVRMGMVVAGFGHCHLPDREIPLEPGAVFLIPSDTIHRFSTSQVAMTVIAYHPDSDFGPDHQNHPMINRTMIDGRSARFETMIQTRSQKVGTEFSAT